MVRATVIDVAINAVTAGRYPDLPVYELTSDLGAAGSFVGRIIDQGLACPKCGTSNTVTVYQGPQAPDVETPFDASPAEVEFTWCTGHGLLGMRLINSAPEGITGE